MHSMRPDYDFLIASMKRVMPLGPEEENLVTRYFKPQLLRKKDHWLLPGKACTQVAFIQQGCLRYYYSRDGAERTGQFFFEGGWMTDYESWLTRQPAEIGVDALEDTLLLAIPFPDLEKIYDAFPRFERFGRLMAENTIIGIRKRNNSLLNETPEERYLQLVRERPKVMSRVPLHLIASYLGIEPESLSRIRKKLSEKGL